MYRLIPTLAAIFAGLWYFAFPPLLLALVVTLGAAAGSVSLACALHSPCPVTVVHSPEAHHQRLHLRRTRHTGADATVS